ncbi:mitochondrial carrier [Stereum hirsutum FP-91666 SS1]|uniref:mitochondrial carrier n=1 Tax=Stereum hirsutum (strain FP-91666) TaxID=721885 RepID=UPI0004449CA6|nr:mitochondrial carrier [Stereum hirsutum FP-91666 SS1]EIM82640.1 mitochondrial carrier [Stereum hirsutum FP-91666 SS1]
MVEGDKPKLTERAPSLSPALPGRTANDQAGLIFASAALANMLASAVSNPLDIIKVRQQLRTQSAQLSSSNAFWTVGAQMAKSEGVLSLMNGLTASMMREIVYSGIRMGTYEYFKDAILDVSAGSLSKDGLTLKVFAATVAATLGSAVANPTDLVKVRMQAHYPEGSPYRNTRHAFATVWREGATSTGTSTPAGGLRSIYRGVDATTARGVVLSVSQICSYDQIKQTLKQKRLMEEGFPLHFTASMFAGFICSVTSNPVDVVKVRVMNDKERRYQGVSDCVKQMLQKEGPKAFYKGFGMCWARLGTHTILSFVAFERLRSLFGIAPM